MADESETTSSTEATDAPVPPPQISQKKFLQFQVGMAVLLFFSYWLMRKNQTSRTGFRVREAELRKRNGRVSHFETDPLGRSKLTKRPKAADPSERLSLPGIRTGGPHHELLGVRENASEFEIQAAYRKLMKRFHPDRVGRPGSREWNDAQEIARAITEAKEAMLKARRSS